MSQRAPSAGPVTGLVTGPRIRLAGLILPAAVVLLAACGTGSSGTTSPPAGSAATGAPVPGPSAGGAGFDPQQLQKIRQCLTAAGFSLAALPSGQPSGFPSGALPSGALPSGALPSGARPPSGIPGGPAGAGAQLNDPRAQAALKACGIVLPSIPAPAAS